MNKLKQWASHRFFLPVLCLLLAALLIFLAGPYIAFAGYTPLQSWLSRIVLFLLIVSAYGLYVYIKHLKQQKTQDNMVKEMTSDDGSADAIDAESQALKEKFKLAFDTLKKTKGGPVSLPEIPWYMIIGSPGSGKTTLLSNSGLRFPLMNEMQTMALQGVGGTKNCDWWITQDAVLLDTAGRYTSQDSFQKVDESGWQNFLAMIKRYRKKPVSGLLVSFSMSDLMTMNEYELSQLTFQLKQRIAEVNDYFSTRFPIYVVITKSDMMAGFTQFYETLSHKEREQVLGVTFNKQISLQEQVTQAFHQEYDKLVASQKRRQWSRISLERDPNRKALVYSYTEQLVSLKPSLVTILEGLSQKDDGVTTGIIRGMYFTSGTQSGAPIDKMIEKVSHAFGLRNTAKVLWNNDSRSYFIKDVLQEVAFNEADQFGTLSGYEKRKSLVKRGLMASAAVLAVALCAGFFVSYNNNADYIVRSDAAVDSWRADYEDKQGNLEIKQYIPALNEFADNIQGLIDTDEAQFSGLGLGQASSLESSLKASYNRLLSTVLLPYVKTSLESKLTQSSDISTQYQALKSYLMMSNGENRDNQFISEFLSNSLNDDQYFSTPEFAQVKVHLDNLVQNDVMFESIDDTLVSRARRNLSAQPLGEIYYKQFKDSYLNDPSKYLSLAQLAGSEWRLIFTTKLDDIQTISSLYTPDQLKKVLSDEIDAYINKLDGEAWILGPDNVINQSGLNKQIEQLYAKDYVNTWQGLLNSVSVKENNNLASINSVLQSLSNVDSPIFALMESAAAATELVDINSKGLNINLSSNANRALDAAQGAMSANDPRFFITSRFSKLHEAMKEEKKIATQQRLTALLQDISVALSFQMQSAQSEVDPKILNGLQGYAYLQTEPLNKWVTQLVTSVQSAQNQIQKDRIAGIWSNQILSVCRDITSSKYPFEPNSSVDASLRDLDIMFSPNGTLFNFFNTHLAPYIDTQRQPWQFKTANGSGFNNDVVSFFERLYKIQQSLYTQSANQASLRFALTPIYLDPRLLRYRMTVYGNTMSYQFGRPTPSTVNWPPANPSARSEYSFVRRDGSELLQASEGLFAFYRLIDNNEIQRKGPTKIELTFSKGNFKAIYEMSTASPADPMVFMNMSKLRCIDSL